MAASTGLDAGPAGKCRRAHRKRGWAALQPLPSAALLHVALLLLVFLAGVGWSSTRDSQIRLPSQPVHTTARGKTLVVYVYGGSDPRKWLGRWGSSVGSRAACMQCCTHAARMKFPLPFPVTAGCRVSRQCPVLLARGRQGESALGCAWRARLGPIPTRPLLPPPALLEREWMPCWLPAPPA